MVNAARHGGGQVSVYAEVMDDSAEVFVRDRGTGFDPDAVPDDRHGLRDSVMGRMERHGGRAQRAQHPRVRDRDPPEPAPGDRGAIVSDPRLRVVLVDDHAMVRAGVRAELADTVEIVGEAADVDEAIAVIVATAPDVVLLDVHLPGGDGRAVLDACLPKVPQTLFLALSVSDAPEDVVAIVRGGARGYVTKAISGPSCARRCSASPTAMPCSRPASPASCSTPSPGCRPSRTTRSTG